MTVVSQKDDEREGPVKGVDLMTPVYRENVPFHKDRRGEETSPTV